MRAKWNGGEQTRVNTIKQFVAYLYCNGWDISIGVSVHFSQPNIEIYLPFGFLRIGWTNGVPSMPLGERQGNRFLYRAFGYNIWY